MNENLLAIRNALNLVGRNTEVQERTSQALPTAGARASIDLLMYSSAEELQENQTNLRSVAEGLFNWGGENKVTKNLIRALTTALNTPGKYAHAVELAAYVSALSPNMEPDRLARLFGAVNEVDTAYAPARYTLQLARKLKPLLSKYPEERQEKLAYSLWVEAHQGRWWDLTAGTQPQPAGEQVAEEEAIPLTEAELIEAYLKRELPYSKTVAEQFRTLPENDLIREALEAYNDDMLKEKVVDPDIALLASHLGWLKPDERPESPVGNLVETLTILAESIEYEFPAKPKKFSDLFPDIRLYGGVTFPFSPTIFRTGNTALMPGVRLNLVRNPTELAANRDYMGNCTWSYKGRMEEGKYVLYRIIEGETIYNASMVHHNNRWTVGEINSRHNRGNVPAAIRAAFEAFVRAVPYEPQGEEVLRLYKDAQKAQKSKYRYQL